MYNKRRKCDWSHDTDFDIHKFALPINNDNKKIVASTLAPICDASASKTPDISEPCLPVRKPHCCKTGPLSLRTSFALCDEYNVRMTNDDLNYSGCVCGGGGNVYLERDSV